jgi:hypothetical protein
MGEYGHLKNRIFYRNMWTLKLQNVTVVDILELFSDKGLVHKVVDEINHYAQLLNNSRGNIFSKL